MGANAGTETHTLTEAQLPTITPAFAVTPNYVRTAVATTGTFEADVEGATAPAVKTVSETPTPVSNTTLNPFGSGQAHNNMQPTTFLNAMVKL